ncbi:MAG TPA: hypothetical protein ENN29_12635 [Candidatus Hydrogenedentes bacterium]|nr:hypothetical protein [Candidatus Hydrogenedentota bacterium]
MFYSFMVESPPRLALAQQTGAQVVVSVLNEKLEAIRALCQVFHVLRLEAFGAVASEDFNPSRDIATFVVECDADNARVQYERFFGLLQGLEILLGCRIDLVDYKALQAGKVVQQIPESRMPVYVAAHQS